MTSLMWAAFNNENPEAPRALVLTGADVNMRDKEGNTNPEMAEMIKALMKAGADVNAGDKKGQDGLKPGHGPQQDGGKRRAAQGRGRALKGSSRLFHVAA